MSGLTVGVDVGGTKIAAGVVDEDGKLIASTRRETPATDTHLVLEAIADGVRELASHHEVVGVGIGAAGFVDAARAKVMFAPNLAWRDEDLRGELMGRLDLPVVVENDANAVAWSESRFGAGRDHDDLVAITIGTGVGGGIVTNGRLLRGGFGVAAEIGHITMVPYGRRCGCGLQGCWEQYGSGRALVGEAREIARHSPAFAAGLLAAAGGDPEAITGEMVTAAAQQGDVGALHCFDEIGRWIGLGLAQLAAVLDPSLFVIGGGVSAAGEVLRGRVEETFRANLTGRGHRPVAEVRLAEMGWEAGMVGAADLARTSDDSAVPGSDR
ncbi:glucokinase [Actinomycetospora sp. NBRC 106375]|uniref:ROK family glucokinase n=1 Tax=Actinomycetospora sp. NBRC 106375 TaxID=3032207 RepID=UPI0024A5E047|nr:ROK family glucokinase [Actinomycetospora sp. NBRC 106375]GLZ44489.1 glucokinase [Actinomycetospora sp. NBRC 106375]